MHVRYAFLCAIPCCTLCMLHTARLALYADDIYIGIHTHMRTEMCIGMRIDIRYRQVHRHVYGHMHVGIVGHVRRHVLRQVWRGVRLRRLRALRVKE